MISPKRLLLTGLATIAAFGDFANARPAGKRDAVTIDGSGGTIVAGPITALYGGGGAVIVNESGVQEIGGGATQFITVPGNTPSATASASSNLLTPMTTPTTLQTSVRPSGANPSSPKTSQQATITRSAQSSKITQSSATSPAPSSSSTLTRSRATTFTTSVKSLSSSAASAPTSSPTPSQANNGGWPDGPKILLIPAYSIVALAAVGLGTWEWKLKHVFAKRRKKARKAQNQASRGTLKSPTAQAPVRQIRATEASSQITNDVVQPPPSILNPEMNTSKTSIFREDLPDMRIESSQLSGDIALPARALHRGEPLSVRAAAVSPLSQTLNNASTLAALGGPDTEGRWMGTMRIGQQQIFTDNTDKEIETRGTPATIGSHPTESPIETPDADRKDDFRSSSKLSLASQEAIAAAPTPIEDARLSPESRIPEAPASFENEEARAASNTTPELTGHEELTGATLFQSARQRLQHVSSTARPSDMRTLGSSAATNTEATAVGLPQAKQSEIPSASSALYNSGTSTDQKSISSAESFTTARESNEDALTTQVRMVLVPERHPEGVFEPHKPLQSKAGGLIDTIVTKGDLGYSKSFSSSAFQASQSTTTLVTSASNSKVDLSTPFDVREDSTNPPSPPDTAFALPALPLDDASEKVNRNAQQGTKLALKTQHPTVVKETGSAKPRKRHIRDLPIIKAAMEAYRREQKKIEQRAKRGGYGPKGHPVIGFLSALAAEMLGAGGYEKTENAQKPFRAVEDVFNGYPLKPSDASFQTSEVSPTTNESEPDKKSSYGTPTPVATTPQPEQSAFSRAPRKPATPEDPSFSIPDYPKLDMSKIDALRAELGNRIENRRTYENFKSSQEQSEYSTPQWHTKLQGPTLSNKSLKQGR